MAVVQRLYTNNLVENAINDFNTLNLSSIQATANQHYKNIRKELQQKEQQLFNAVGVKDVKGLAKRINEIIYGAQKITGATWLDQLTGPDLYTIIDPAQFATSANIDKEEKKWTYLMGKLVTSYIDKGFLSNDREEQEALGGQLVVQALRHYRDKHKKDLGITGDIKTKAKYAIRSAKGIYMQVIGDKPTFAFNANELTDGVKNFLKEYERTHPVNVDNITIKTQENLATITNYMTKTEAVSTFDEKARQKIFKKIAKYLSKVLNIPDTDGFTNYIFRLLSTRLDDNSFIGDSMFVGNNIKQGLTGILGELRAYYILSHLFPNQAVIDTKVDFLASQQDQNKTSSVDLLLYVQGQVFNVQVKNTTKDLKTGIAHEVGFMERITNNDADGFFEALPALYEGNDDTYISQIFQSYAFNIPYGFDQELSVFTQVEDNPNFTARPKLIEAYNKAVKILSKYADVLMFMQTSNPIEDTRQGNILWFVGDGIISATQILDKLYNQYEGDFRFKITPYYEVNQEATTIVDSLNTIRKSVKTDGNLGEKTKTQKFSANLKLRTSFVFTDDILTR